MTELKKNIAAHYDQYSENYDQKNKITSQKIIDELAFQTIKLLVSGKEVLEVGCGTGLWMEELQPLAKAVTGVDLSAGMVKQAKQKGLRAAVGDAENLPCTDSSFDFVYSYRVLPHVPHLPLAIKEIKRVLRNEGKAILMLYNKKSLKYLSRKSKMEEKVFTSFHTIGEIQALDPSLHFIGGYKILPYPKGLAGIPGFNLLYEQAEQLCSKTFLRRYGGNILFEMRK